MKKLAPDSVVPREDPYTRRSETNKDSGEKTEETPSLKLDQVILRP